MGERPCAQCGDPMPLMVRAHARTCSARCRQARSRALRALPDELTCRPRWVRHTAAKRPLTASGRPASVTDQSTWCTYAQAHASNAGAGMGLVLDGDGLVCVDLDHGLDADGRVLPWAAAVLDRLPASYTEVSPSGRGLHVWGFGRVARGRRLRVRGGTVEVYGDGRYITVTGRCLPGSARAVAELGDVVAALS